METENLHAHIAIPLIIEKRKYTIGIVLNQISTRISIPYGDMLSHILHKKNSTLTGSIVNKKIVSQPIRWFPLDSQKMITEKISYFWFVTTTGYLLVPIQVATTSQIVETFKNKWRCDGNIIRGKLIEKEGKVHAIANIADRPWMLRWRVALASCIIAPSSMVIWAIVWYLQERGIL